MNFIFKDLNIKHHFCSVCRIHPSKISQNVQSQLNLNNTLLVVYLLCFILFFCCSFISIDASIFWIYVCSTWHESTKNVHIHIHGSVLGRRYHWSQKTVSNGLLTQRMKIYLLSFSFPFRFTYYMGLTSNERTNERTNEKKKFWWCWFSDNIINFALWPVVCSGILLYVYREKTRQKFAIQLTNVESILCVLHCIYSYTYKIWGVYLL